ncbi:uncharacterized protein LOC128205667 [Mya arenaria]|uniref:uncharacterized protein LOC128205667 n=1 Tax=Mya arenaria TaxID=6604 RepID=UPI0022E69629|nr:uncharacterized protein LOC128205667 [Mya arenaria]
MADTSTGTRGGPVSMTTNTTETREPIDDDILHTVGRLFHVRPQQSTNKGKKESTEEIVRRALQAERNHWKERLHMSMLEIDRQHKVILTTQSGLQELVRSLKQALKRNSIMEEEVDEDLDNETVALRLLENLKFQVRQLKVKAGVADVSKNDFEDAQNKNRQIITELRDKLKALEKEKKSNDHEIQRQTEKIVHLQKENSSLHRQLMRMQKIVQKYNEGHNGANFHLNNVDAPVKETSRHDYERKTGHTNSVSTLELTDSNGSSHIRERTYVEGDQLVSYPNPNEENAIIKDRLRKNIYSARQGDNRSSNVAQCSRCHVLFKPGENTHKSCRFHHKGREIKEQFDTHGRLEQVLYKWACCKKSLESPGCCFGYHV